MRARQYLYRELVGFLVQHPGLIEPISKARMRRQVKDPELRAKLTPNYRMGCKRIIVTDDFHPALAKPNVSVITEPHHRDPARRRSSPTTAPSTRSTR